MSRFMWSKFKLALFHSRGLSTETWSTNTLRVVTATSRPQRVLKDTEYRGNTPPRPNFARRDIWHWNIAQNITPSRQLFDITSWVLCKLHFRRKSLFFISIRLIKLRVKYIHSSLIWRYLSFFNSSQSAALKLLHPNCVMSFTVTDISERALFIRDRRNDGSDKSVFVSDLPFWRHYAIQPSLLSAFTFANWILFVLYWNLNWK